MKKSDAKMLLMVAGGVMLAGLLMAHGRNLPVVGDASRGFDGQSAGGKFLGIF